MNIRKFYGYFISPTITIFLVTTLINYAQINSNWLTKNAVTSLICGSIVACIYYAWDYIKKRKQVEV